MCKLEGNKCNLKISSARFLVYVLSNSLHVQFRVRSLYFALHLFHLQICRSRYSKIIQLSRVLSNHKMNMDVNVLCLICGSPLADGETVTVKVGMKNLKRCSAERNDGLRDVMDLNESLSLHVACRRNYIDPANIKRCVSLSATNDKSTATLLRSSVQNFQFKTHCLICGEEHNDDVEIRKPKHLRKNFHQVLTQSFQETVSRVAADRDDELGRTVLHRIGCFDLIAYECHYHGSCYTKFFSNLPAAKGPRRPLDPEHHIA